MSPQPRPRPHAGQRPLRSLAVALLALAGIAGLAASAAAITVNGRVVQTTAPGPVPVACCDVEARIHYSPTTGDMTATGRTRSDGTFSIDVPCNFPPTAPLEVTARSLCCGGTSAPVTVIGCRDSLGVGWVVNAGDIACINVPITGRALLSGRVLCRESTLFTHPVEGCSILIQGSFTGAVTTLARTDASGQWEACVPCDATVVPVYALTAQCCGMSQTITLLPGCGAFTVPDFVCGSCPVPVCPNPDMVQVTGFVGCQNPTGVITPVPAGCTVTLTTTGPDTNGDGVPNDCGPSDTRTALTGADGRYTVCVPCPVNPACGSATWQISTSASCCTATTTTTVLGCPTTVDQGNLVCVGPCPGTTRPCGTAGTRIFGTLTCADSTGGISGVPGCTISIEPACPVGTPVTTTTDASGNFSACWPSCTSCPTVLVRAVCCGVVRTVDLSSCPAEVGLNLMCTTPCAPTRCSGPGMPPGTQVSGQLICASGTTGTPIGGQTIQIRWYYSSTSTFVSETTAVTDGTGHYTACLPCDTGGPDLIVARSLGCDGQSTTTVTGCPVSASLATIYCTDCSPCPTGSTRIQGRVNCRGGGPVRGCTVTITVNGCGTTQTFTTVTDSSGQYRLCVPCPCTGRTIHVQACCGASVTVAPTRCGPTTPIPTLFCGTTTPCR